MKNLIRDIELRINGHFGRGRIEKLRWLNNELHCYVRQTDGILAWWVPTKQVPQNSPLNVWLLY